MSFLLGFALGVACMAVVNLLAMWAEHPPVVRVETVEDDDRGRGAR